MKIMNESIFENPSVDINDLPSIETLSIKKPHKNYLYVGLLGNTIFMIFMAALFITATITASSEFSFIKPVAISLFLLLAIYTYVMSFYSYKLKGYGLRNKDITYHKGVFFQSKTTIPFNRVQHCEITQGPIERMFELKSLVIYTAGGQSSDLNINGLEPHEAEQLKEYIVSATKKDQDGEQE